MQVYSLSLQMVTWLDELVIPALRKRRPSLANQAERAADSVVLNIFEGRSARGKRGAHRFDIALGSARETFAVVDLAVALRLVPAARVESLRDRLDHICAILWKLRKH